jgi:hypothetical protein
MVDLQKTDPKIAVKIIQDGFKEALKRHKRIKPWGANVLKGIKAEDNNE